MESGGENGFYKFAVNLIDNLTFFGILSRSHTYSARTIPLTMRFLNGGFPNSNVDRTSSV